MTRTLALTLDQFYRPQPGGVATYVRGLIQGLAHLETSDVELRGVVPRGAVPPSVAELPVTLSTAPLGVRLLTLVWSRWPVGVPGAASIVHAASMAGPFGGGRRDAVHSVAVHDLLWRDAPDASTPAGIRFHERRLALLERREDLRVFVSSPGLSQRLAAEGFASSRLHEVRLGVDDDATAPASEVEVRRLLEGRGVRTGYTLYVGTREPRKNIERLVRAHRQARSRAGELGPLVLVGPAGWGEVDTGDAIVLGVLERPLVKGLYRDATVTAYVARAEGWGLPPVEALHAGSRVVASRTTPSVSSNLEVTLVDPLDEESIADGFVRSLETDDDAPARARRRASVAELTWRNAALDHLAGWR
ncbi:MAG TPA: glycosyltransferase [Acidimicrobiales bacterium]|nr:glycosyltransferase [Acidimicrobiales bacterium]